MVYLKTDKGLLERVNNLSKLREITGTSANRLRCEKLCNFGQTFKLLNYRFLLKMRCPKIKRVELSIVLSAEKKKKDKILTIIVIVSIAQPVFV